MAKLTNTLVDGWTSSGVVDAWARTHGFGPSITLTDAELARLPMTVPAGPAGLYMWEGEQHGIYIGVSTVSVATRLRQHVKNFPSANIQAFRYLPQTDGMSALRLRERELVYSATASGFTAYNNEYASGVIGPSVLDDLIDPAVQAEWFDDPLAANLADDTPRNQVNKSETARSRDRFDGFMKRADAQPILDALSTYIACCIPLPGKTAESFWTVSLPVMSYNGIRRVSTVNMGMLEMLWISEYQSGEVTVCMGTHNRFVPQGRSWASLSRAGIDYCGRVHKEGGAEEQVVEAHSPRQFVRALANFEELRLGAARFALDRMRKGRVSGRYREAHNFLLADEALRRMEIRGKDLPRSMADDVPVSIMRRGSTTESLAKRGLIFG